VQPFVVAGAAYVVPGRNLIPYMGDTNEDTKRLVGHLWFKEEHVKSCKGRVVYKNNQMDKPQGVIHTFCVKNRRRLMMDLPSNNEFTQFKTKFITFYIGAIGC
jgi:hypothetical protein